MCTQIPISVLEGKTVGLYFCATSYKSCSDFTSQLVEVYEKLKAKGENFEVVLMPLDDDEELFTKSLESMPWLSLPFKDKTCGKLIRYFELSTLPTLVIIGPDGKTLNPNVTEAIEEHGVNAYPFTPEKFSELDEIMKAKEAAQTIESILVSGDQDFVIGKDGVKVKLLIIEINYVLLCNPPPPSSSFICSILSSLCCDIDNLAFIPISDSSVRIEGEEHPPLLLSSLVSSMPCISSETH